MSAKLQPTRPPSAPSPNAIFREVLALPVRQHFDPEAGELVIPGVDGSGGRLDAFDGALCEFHKIAPGHILATTQQPRERESQGVCEELRG